MTPTTPLLLSSATSEHESVWNLFIAGLISSPKPDLLTQSLSVRTLQI